MYTRDLSLNLGFAFYSFWSLQFLIIASHKAYLKSAADIVANVKVEQILDKNIFASVHSVQHRD